MRKYFNQTLKRTLTASVAAILCATTLSFGSIAEDVTERHVTETHICCGGVIPESDEVFMEHLARESNIEKDGVALRSGYPLCSSTYFPAIGSQGGVGSWTALSTVYYQFTYEANKLNDITIGNTVLFGLG